MKQPEEMVGTVHLHRESFLCGADEMELYRSRPLAILENVLEHRHRPQ
jgi:hypothetical protein